MSVKTWLRKVLGVEPQVIVRTTFVYPTCMEKDGVENVLRNNDTWFHFSTQYNYDLDDYGSDIYKCASALLGPSKANEVLEGIRRKWGVPQFYEHGIAEGKVVVDYINSEPALLKHFHHFNQTEQKEQYELSEREFKALESLETQIVDLKLMQYEFAEDAEVLIGFVKKFTKSEVKEEVEKG